MILLCLITLLSLGAQAQISGPLTDDFKKWLESNGYGPDNFSRDDYQSKGSFGGLTESATTVHNTPVIFIHGNSDSALKSSSSATGWDKSIQYFLTKGYTSAEVYATSWGDNKASNAGTRTHNCFDLQRLRRFVEAVLAYTKKPKVSIVSHSMGVTLMRKAVLGGSISASDGNCNLGTALNDKIEVFVGLSGANYGLCACEGSGTIEHTCNKKNGLWPGDSCGLNYLTCGLKPLPWPCSSVTYSSFLMEMNDKPVAVAEYIFSAWSYSDTLIGYENEVWARPTSLIPLSTGKKIYDTYSHMETKELTYDDQYQMVKNHTL
ncbi:unnamed protein product [Auanema sp. JU1783]|nr:unnamed protein product [Auanema sp. JU1783]